MSKMIVTNIGTIATGDLNAPLFQGDTIVIEDKIITAMGGRELVKEGDGTVIVDAMGTTVLPGLFDSHVHTVIGEYTPRQDTLNYIYSYMHGGVTSIITAGEAHLPGRPRDASGAKALAILAHKSYEILRPSGVKVHGGGLMLEHGLVEADFAEMAREGVWIVGEIGLGSATEPEEVAPMVEWAHKYGFKVHMHTGGTSIPGSSTVKAEQIIAIRPDVISHINGGTTALSLEDTDRLMDETPFAMEIIQAGNAHVADYILRRAKKKGMLDRIIFGTDTPTGTGVLPLGILRSLAQTSSLSDIDPAVAVCMGTGNTARVFGLNAGILAPGREGDLIICDAPMGCSKADAMSAIAYGDLPGLSHVIIDGEITMTKSKNTPPPQRPAQVVSQGNG